MRNFYALINTCRAFLLVLVFLGLSQTASAFAPKRDFYQLKVYYLKDQTQESRVEAYLKNAYLPALHRAGIKKVGVFKPVATDTAAGKRLYVFIPLKSMDQLIELPKALQKDKAYASAGQDYLQAAHNNLPYRRMENIVLQAFTHMPQFKAPTFSTPTSERVYELRSYESGTEALHENKVRMFNEGGEVKIFDKLGFNAVFYSQVIAGSRMPNLMYMTSFANKQSRDEHWKAFSSDPDWKVLSAKPEFKNNVSKIHTYFLYPTDYSDI